MSDFNRPDRHRLSRVHKRVEKALDFLAQAHGEMRPAKFAKVRGDLDRTMGALENLQHFLVQEIASGNQRLPLDSDENEPETNETERPKRGRAAAE